MSLPARYPIWLWLAWIGLALSGCGRSKPISETEPLRLAVAANLRPLAEQWKVQFKAQTGNDLDLVVGSTGQLFSQIEQGAPFHLFFAAEPDVLQRLHDQGKALAPVQFAAGSLGFWQKGISQPDPLLAHIPWDSIRHLAIPNPAVAPYGLAARQMLQNMGIWAKMQSRIVYGESAGKTAILMSSGSVEAGITAYSLLLDSSWQQLGTVVEISPEIHSPIWQSYAVLQQGIGHPALNAFLQYLHAPQTQRMLQAWGYEPAVEGTAMGGPQLGSDRKLDFQPFLLSGLLALATTLALLLVGIPLAWWLSVPSGKWKAVPEVLVTLPLILPPTVLGFYLLLALSPESWLGGTFSEVFGMDLSFSFLGLWIASMVYSLPFMVNPLLAGFRQLPAHLSEAGSVFGLGRWQILRKLLLPNLWGTIGSAAIFTFAHTVGEFGVVLMIGGSVPGKTRVVSIALYEEVETLQYGNAHIYAVILLAFAFVTLLIARLLSQGRKHTPI